MTLITPPELPPSQPSPARHPANTRLNDKPETQGSFCQNVPPPTCTPTRLRNDPLLLPNFLCCPSARHWAPKVNAGCWKLDNCPPRPTISPPATAPGPCQRPCPSRCDLRLTQSPLLPCSAITHFNKPKDPSDPPTSTLHPRMNYTSQIQSCSAPLFLQGSPPTIGKKNYRKQKKLWFTFVFGLILLWNKRNNLLVFCFDKEFVFVPNERPRNMFFFLLFLSTRSR